MRIWVEFEVLLNKFQMKTLVQNENINTWVYFKEKKHKNRTIFNSP